ncbi:MAG: argininosuccinate lyase, partial [Halanaeroarchaeum sp.]
VRRDRFSGGPAREFLSSMADDERIFAADLAVDRAHVVMLAEQDVVAEDEATEILGALDRVETDGFGALPDGEDVHEAIETAVIEEVGSVGGKMHTARSRNDEVATCIRYRLRADLLDAAETAVGFRDRLLDVADEHVETVMPGYTHLQPAQPTTVAHWLASYEGGVRRDTGRLLDAYDRTNRSPLGGAALAGTPFDVDRERTADLLGFDGVVENAMDAASARDFLIESVAALAGLATTLSGLAEDLIVLANDGLVDLDDDYASTSSIMPQKKNPDTLELVRATAGDASAALDGLLTTLKGLPRAYNRDLQSATGHAWRAVDEVIEATAVAGGAVATADWPAERLGAAAGRGFATATGVADLFATHGMPFRTAHEIVARAAEAAGDGDRDAQLAAIREATRAVTGDDLASIIDPDAVAEMLDPAASVRARDSRGGPAPAVVRDALADARAAVAADEEAIDRRRTHVERADRARAEVVADYA